MQEKLAKVTFGQSNSLMDQLIGINPQVIVGNHWAHKIKSTEPLGIEGMFIRSWNRL